jgi:hypothetical protein
MTIPSLAHRVGEFNDADDYPEYVEDAIGEILPA